MVRVVGIPGQQGPDQFGPLIRSALGEEGGVFGGRRQDPDQVQVNATQEGRVIGDGGTGQLLRLHPRVKDAIEGVLAAILGRRQHRRSGLQGRLVSWLLKGKPARPHRPLGNPRLQFGNLRRTQARPLGRHAHIQVSARHEL